MEIPLIAMYLLGSITFMFFIYGMYGLVREIEITKKDIYKFITLVVIVGISGVFYSLFERNVLPCGFSIINNSKISILIGTLIASLSIHLTSKIWNK